MKLKIILTILILLFCRVGFCAVEDFANDWTETDPNNRLSQTTTRSTYTALTLDELAYLNRDSGVSFTEDWDIAFDFYVDSASDTVSGIGTGLYSPHNLNFNDGGDNNALVGIYNWDDSKVFVTLVAAEKDGPTADTDFDNTTLNLNTVYYARFRRDDDAGTNGTLYLDIYASSTNRDNDASVLVSLETAITVYGKIDFTFATCPFSEDFDVGNNFLTGYIENLVLAYVPPPTANTTDFFQILLSY